MATAIKFGLELGAGEVYTRRPGWISADFFPGPNIDVVMDATKPWPFKDECFDYINCNHVIEHLPNIDNFMNEAWRVLPEPPGSLTLANMRLRLPYGPSENGFGDITHIRYYTATSWAAFTPATLEISHNPQHRKRQYWSIYSVGMRVNRDLRLLMKPGIRSLGKRIVPYLWGGFTEMIVDAAPIKTPERIAWWRTRPECRTVHCYYWIYDFEYNGQPKPTTPERNMIIF